MWRKTSLSKRLTGDKHVWKEWCSSQNTSCLRLAYKHSFIFCAPSTPLVKEGPIHDVQWSPKGNFFLVVAGFMPAKVILFNSACVPKFDLGELNWWV